MVFRAGFERLGIWGGNSAGDHRGLQYLSRNASGASECEFFRRGAYVRRSFAGVKRDLGLVPRYRSEWHQQRASNVSIPSYRVGGGCPHRQEAEGQDP